MHIPKKYIHDRVILLLLSANFFLFAITTVSVILKLIGNTSTYYTVQYRPHLGRAEEYFLGGVIDIISFPVFSLIVFVSYALLSIRAYTIQRNLANTVLALGTLLLVLSLIISNSLLVL